MHVSEEDRLSRFWRNLSSFGRYSILIALFSTLLVVNVSALTATRQARDREAFAQNLEVLYVPGTPQLRLMFLGYDQLAADVVWLRVLSYFDRHFRGDREYEWLEYFLDQIITLDPAFHAIYHWAGTNVLYGRRFTNENVELSNRFYRLALEREPDDYEAAYRLGMNYYVEMRSEDLDEQRAFKETGLTYLERAANTPGSSQRLRHLVASISRKLGKEQLALQYLLDLYVQTDDVEKRENLGQRIAKMRAEMSMGAFEQEASRFRSNWKTHFGYVSPAFYVVLGEPEGLQVADLDWRAIAKRPPSLNSEESVDSGALE